MGGKKYGENLLFFMGFFVIFRECFVFFRGDFNMIRYLSDLKIQIKSFCFIDHSLLLWQSFNKNQHNLMCFIKYHKIPYTIK